MKSSTLSNIELSIESLVGELAQLLQKHGCMLTTAESCTGGMIASACTDLAGSSLWFERGFVTYSNAAKTEMLGVAAGLISQHGAVSQQVASAMAQGSLKHSNAQVSVAVTGVAGPSGGSVEKPVGLVWFGFEVASPALRQGKAWTERQQFDGDRNAVRQATVRHALQTLINALEKMPLHKKP